MLLNHETSRVFLINHPNRLNNEQSNTGFKTPTMCCVPLALLSLAQCCLFNLINLQGDMFICTA